MLYKFNKIILTNHNNNAKSQRSPPHEKGQNVQVNYKMSTNPHRNLNTY